MLLLKLQNGEKFAFLNLAYYIANVDGEFDKEEKDIIEEYCSEMGIDNINYKEDDFNLKETLNKIKTPKSQKIVLLELMILVHSDNKYHRFEQNIINEIANHFNIAQNQLEIFSEWGKMTSGLYRQGNLLIQD
jgi:tellurite resistance protein